MRAGAVLALALLALAGCGSTARPVLPPSPQWNRIAAGLRGPLDRSSADVCARGAPGCVRAVVAEMERRLAGPAARCEHGAAFALMYLRVTQAVERADAAATVSDAPYLAHLDAVFARLYFDAADAWARDDSAAVPPAWQVAFELADRKRASGVGDLLLGMNAHISRDLPFAVAQVGDLTPARLRAFTQVNGILARVSRPILVEESKRFDPTIASFSLPVLKTSFAELGQLLAGWRAAALRDGERLLAARTPRRRAAVARSIEQTALARAAIIAAATSRVPFSKAGRARDAFCRSRSG